MLADYHQIGTARLAGQSLDRELYHRAPFKFPVISPRDATKPLFFPSKLCARCLILDVDELIANHITGSCQRQPIGLGRKSDQRGAPSIRDVSRKTHTWLWPRV